MCYRFCHISIQIVDSVFIIGRQKRRIIYFAASAFGARKYSCEVSFKLGVKLTDGGLRGDILRTFGPAGSDIGSFSDEYKR